MLLPGLPVQEVAGAAHPLAGTIANLVWLVPVLPFIGFLVNGMLSLLPATHMGPADPSAAGHRHEHAGEAHADHGHDNHHHVARHPYHRIVSLVGPAVLGIAFALTVAIFFALSGAHAEEPFVRTLFPWLVTGDLRIDAAFQVDQLSIV